MALDSKKWAFEIIQELHGRRYVLWNAKLLPGEKRSFKLSDETITLQNADGQTFYFFDSKGEKFLYDVGKSYTISTVNGQFTISPTNTKPAVNYFLIAGAGFMALITAIGMLGVYKNSLSSGRDSGGSVQSSEARDAELKRQAIADYQEKVRAEQLALEKIAKQKKLEEKKLKKIAMENKRRAAAALKAQLAEQDAKKRQRAAEALQKKQALEKAEKLKLRRKKTFKSALRRKNLKEKKLWHALKL